MDPSAFARSWRQVAWVAGLVLVATVVWLVYLDRAWGYVVLSDSALYLDGALHLGRGEGLGTLVGYPEMPSASPLFPAYFHPPGSLVPYALAALGAGSDRIAIGLAVSLAFFLGTVVLIAVVVARLTTAAWFGAVVGLAYALDPRVLGEMSSVATTVPDIALVATVAALLASRWPPSARRAAVVGVTLAAAHFVRFSELPIAVAVVGTLAWERRWTVAGWLAGTYVLGLAIETPFIPSSVSQAMVLLSDTKGFEGFPPAQFVSPTMLDVLGHWPAVARKTVANLAANLVLFPSGGDPYVALGGLGAGLALAVRGERRSAILLIAFGGTFLLGAAIAIGPRYLIHLVAPIYLLGALVLWRTTERARPIAALAFLGLALALYLGDLHELDRARSATVARGSAYVAAGRAAADLTTSSETLLSGAPANLALYGDRRSFNIPIHANDLQRVVDAIGGARLLVLQRSEVDDTAGYPDPTWREGFASDRIGDFRLVRVIGEGVNETRFYRRP